MFIDDIQESKEKASAGKRFVAYFIDLIIQFVVSLIPVVGWIVGLAYAFTKDALPFLNGQSLGKRAMGIRVVKTDSFQPITNDYGAAILRQVSLAIPFFGLIDALMVFSDSQMRFGDKWAKTIVVEDHA